MNFSVRNIGFGLLLSMLPLHAFATPTVEVAGVTPRAATTFDPSTITHTLCRADLMQYLAADWYKLQEGVNYLTNLKPPVWCNCNPHSCVRVSCSWNAAIYLCNDRDDEIFVTCPDVADYVRWVEDKCRYIVYPTYAVLGQAFDQGNWNVLVRGDHC